MLKDTLSYYNLKADVIIGSFFFKDDINSNVTMNRTS